MLRTLLIILFACNLAYGQSAKDVFDELLEKNGPWKDVKTLRFTTTRKNHNKWQNYSFTKPVATNDEAYAEFDFTNKRYFTKTIGRYGGGYEFIFATVGKDTTRWFYDVNQSRNGRQMLKSGKGVFENSFAFANAFFPYYNLKAVKESGDSLSMGTGNEGKHITRNLRNGLKIDYYFGKDDLLSKISRVQGGKLFEQLFSDYTNSNNLNYAMQIETYIDKVLTTVDRIKTLETNTPFNVRLLDVPSDYTIAGPAKTIQTTEIAKDVFLIEGIGGDRNVLFINMDDHIFVTEAPLNSETTKVIADIIHKTVPNKPIKYVHLSHFHNDHVNGIRTWVSEGATIITTPPTVDPIKTLIEDKSGHFKDELAKNYRPGNFQTFNKVKVLKDSNHEIQLHEIKNGHAQGMSFVYLPKEQIIYQGDLYSVPEDAVITPAIEITRDFNRYVQKNKLKVKRIIGHHGLSNITPEMLSKAIGMK
jgi:glyoxylase-like metal-dependent hydrolase (beta-lactamase superfamily II)